MIKMETEKKSFHSSNFCFLICRYCELNWKLNNFQFYTQSLFPSFLPFIKSCVRCIVFMNWIKKIQLFFFFFSKNQWTFKWMKNQTKLEPNRKNFIIWLSIVEKEFFLHSLHSLTIVKSIILFFFLSSNFFVWTLNQIIVVIIHWCRWKMLLFK